MRDLEGTALAGQHADLDRRNKLHVLLWRGQARPTAVVFRKKNCMLFFRGRRSRADCRRVPKGKLHVILSRAQKQGGLPSCSGRKTTCYSFAGVEAGRTAVMFQKENYMLFFRGRSLDACVIFCLICCSLFPPLLRVRFKSGISQADLSKYFYSKTTGAHPPFREETFCRQVHSPGIPVSRRPLLHRFIL